MVPDKHISSVSKTQPMGYICVQNVRVLLLFYSSLWLFSTVSGCRTMRPGMKKLKTVLVSQNHSKYTEASMSIPQSSSEFLHIYQQALHKAVFWTWGFHSTKHLDCGPVGYKTIPIDGYQHFRQTCLYLPGRGWKSSRTLVTTLKTTLCFYPTDHNL